LRGTDIQVLVKAISVQLSLESSTSENLILDFWKIFLQMFYKKIKK